MLISEPTGMHRYSGLLPQDGDDHSSLALLQQYSAAAKGLYSLPMLVLERKTWMMDLLEPVNTISITLL